MKEYKTPEMNISMFSIENIVTESGLETNVTKMSAEMQDQGFAVRTKDIFEMTF
ncbi:MAG: hypothetical protein ACI4DP_06860 [Candidatus Ornithomonoglobus sp.]